MHQTLTDYACSIHALTYSHPCIPPFTLTSVQVYAHVPIHSCIPLLRLYGGVTFREARQAAPELLL